MVYLLHFNSRYKHAAHYIGYAKEKGFKRRISRHRQGHGARLTAILLSAGIGFIVARTWPGADRLFERQLKRRGSALRICPICNPVSAMKRAIGQSGIPT